MKYLSVVFLALFIVFSTYGQTSEKPVDKVSTSTVYTFNYKKGSSSIPYKITTFKKKVSPIKLENEDEKKVNYNQEDTPDYVTKLVHVDHMVDDTLDQFIVLKYIEENADSFEAEPTDKGFIMLVDGKQAEYIFGEGIFFSDKENKDFFIVNEFASL
ncbi:hypothetical protein NBT05_01225 [Aquimarina sp. ERC-38]|uniref:hypothetical protein n=1 Tax=Aquimarina sp. ERC-38 TaxID=2949996 RepID=UPI0022462565|nr:hypothetical protein [Aquimarina sp. ERC-38]UZO81113.1 hypothetical protein NBT05_01225 [Aquimarina sp. ERC-38]